MKIVIQKGAELTVGRLENTAEFSTIRWLTQERERDPVMKKYIREIDRKFKKRKKSK